jgi:hypothetical protein
VREDCERCSHYASFHFLELRGTELDRLGTSKFLGREPMQRHDAIAYVLNGVRYKSTGCGFRGGYAGPTFPQRFAGSFTTHGIGLKR